MFSTRTKITFAKIAQRPIRAVRRLAGRPARDIFLRDGLRYELDLNEGIDFAIYLFGCFEPKMVRAYGSLLRPGSVVLDIGANVGAHTVQFAKRVTPGGRVVAFEPTDYAFQKLRRNVSLNPSFAPAVEAHQLFLTATDDAVKPTAVYSSWPLDGADSLHSMHQGALKSVSQAGSVRLDTFCRDQRITRIDLIKLDVDGYEIEVLRGAQEVLARHKPKILMEIAPEGFADFGHTFSELIALIVAHGYRMQNLSTQRDIPIVEQEIVRQTPAGGGINVLLY